MDSIDYENEIKRLNNLIDYERNFGLQIAKSIKEDLPRQIKNALALELDGLQDIADGTRDERTRTQLERRLARICKILDSFIIERDATK